MSQAIQNREEKQQIGFATTFNAEPEESLSFADLERFDLAADSLASSAPGPEVPVYDVPVYDAFAIPVQKEDAVPLPDATIPVYDAFAIPVPEGAAFTAPMPGDMTGLDPFSIPVPENEAFTAPLPSDPTGLEPFSIPASEGEAFTVPMPSDMTGLEPFSIPVPEKDTFTAPVNEGSTGLDAFAAPDIVPGPASAGPSTNEFPEGQSTAGAGDKEGLTPNREGVYWGTPRNGAPTRESIAAFLDKPVDFPFDENKERAFDFEPIESKIQENVPERRHTSETGPSALNNATFPVQQKPDRATHTGMTEGKAEQRSIDDETELTDEAPRFYKEYTQGIKLDAIEAANNAAKANAAKSSAAKPSSPGKAKEVEPADALPEFLTAYDTEPLGRPTSIAVPEKPAKKTVKAKAETEEDIQQEKDNRKANAKRQALSVIITILIVVLVLFVTCVIILRFMPGSIGAFYIQDLIEFVQGRLGRG